jgi:hypothetical protein
LVWQLLLAAAGGVTNPASVAMKTPNGAKIKENRFHSSNALEEWKR